MQLPPQTPNNVDHAKVITEMVLNSVWVTCTTGADVAVMSQYTCSSFMELIVQAMGLLPNWHAGYRVLTAIVPAATAQQRHDFLAKHANLLLQLMWAGIQDDHQINDKSRDSLTMLQTLLNLLGFGRDYTLSPNGTLW